MQISVVLMNYFDDQMKNEIEFEGQDIPGWRCLPRVCLSIFSANTFFYTCFMDRLS